MVKPDPELVEAVLRALEKAFVAQAEGWHVRDMTRLPDGAAEMSLDGYFDMTPVAEAVVRAAGRWLRQVAEEERDSGELYVAGTLRDLAFGLDPAVEHLPKIG